jgi:hypothetical protein
LAVAQDQLEAQVVVTYERMSQLTDEHRYGLCIRSCCECVSV